MNFSSNPKNGNKLLFCWPIVLWISMTKESVELSFLCPVQALEMQRLCVCVLLLPASVCAPGADWKPLYAAGFHCKAVARQESSLCESEDQARHRAPPSSHSKACSEKNFSKSHSNPESDWEASAVIVRFKCYLGSFDNSSLCNFWFFTWFSLQGSCAKLLMEKM